MADRKLGFRKLSISSWQAAVTADFSAAERPVDPMCPPSSRNFAMARHELMPVPGQKLIEPVAGVVVDAGEHVCEPGLRIDVVELCRHDQRRHDGGAVGAAIRAGEEPGFAPESEA